jgi:hypothetical protein
MHCPGGRDMEHAALSGCSSLLERVAQEAQGAWRRPLAVHLVGRLIVGRVVYSTWVDPVLHLKRPVLAKGHCKHGRDMDIYPST